MTDLAAWLLEQIAADEEWARRFGCDDEHDGLDTTPRCMSRVLAECEAKRRIVAQHPSRVYTDEEPGFVLLLKDHSCPGSPGFPCDTLRFLALPYADRPGYLEEWRP